MTDPRTGLPMFLQDRQLHELYQRTPGGAVSFIDESYRTRPGAEAPFYSMSAVTFALDRLDDIRESMTEIAGGRYWHTTEAFTDGNRDAIARMGRYIANHSEWNVVTVDTPIMNGDRGLTHARATCLAAITREVTRGTGPDAVRLLVADRNRDAHLNRADANVVAMLRGLGEIDRSVTLHHGRMAKEPVLWAADTISWSAYRNIAVDDDRWIAPVRDMLTVLDARSGRPLDMKQPQAAAALGAVAPPPGARQPVASERGGASVASEVSLDAHDIGQQAPTDFARGTRTLDDLARQIVAGRTAGGAAAYAKGNTPDSITARLQRLREQHAQASGRGTSEVETGRRRQGPQL